MAVPELDPPIAAVPVDIRPWAAATLTGEGGSWLGLEAASEGGTVSCLRSRPQASSSRSGPACDHALGGGRGGACEGGACGDDVGAGAGVSQGAAAAVAVLAVLKAAGSGEAATGSARWQLKQMRSRAPRRAPHHGQRLTSFMFPTPAHSPALVAGPPQKRRLRLTKG
jgi:hypothetical protein